MIPFGFIGWQSPLQPDPGEEILVVLPAEHAAQRFVRGVARELAAAWGEAIVAWRRHEPLPAAPAGWQAFPDAIPADGQRVAAMFLDTIGWRALTVRGEMAERRFDRPTCAVCVYHAGPPFGLFVDRRPLAGFAPCDDRRRWAAYAWRPAGAEEVTA